MSDTVRHHDCPNVHLGGAAVCRDCRGLYEQDRVEAERAGASEAQKEPVKVAPVSVPVIVDSGDVVAEPQVSDEVADAPSKAARIDVARTALTNAEKCRRRREKKKLEDPDFLSREAERQRKRRQSDG